MPKRSNEFQKLVYLVNKHAAEGATVTESKMLEDRLTGAKREVDICIERSVAGYAVVISIECRDHARKCGPGWVDEMRAKHERLPTKVLILAARRGFTPEALEVAQRYDIETLSLDTLDENSVGRLFGDLGSAWAKLFTLSPTKVVIRVAKVQGLPAEHVVVAPDHTVFKDDGTEFCSVMEMVQHLTKSDQVTRRFGVQGDESHRGFIIQQENPSDDHGCPVYLQMVQPRLLRQIESVQVTGKADFHLSEIALEHGIIGKTRVAWGKGKLGDKDALLVASEDEAGYRRTSLNLSS